MKRRLIRFLKWAGMVVLVLAVVHGVVTMILGRRFAAAVAKAKASGQYVSCAGLGGPPVADADNAAVVYKRVFERLDAPGSKKHLAALQTAVNSEKVSPPTFWVAISLEEQEKIEQSGDPWGQAAKANAYLDGIIPQVKEALARPQCKFPVRWQDGFAALFPHYTELRTLNRVLAAQAVVLAHEGKMDAAVERLELCFALDRNTCNEPILIAPLVKSSMLQSTIRALEAVVRHGDLSEAQASDLRANLSLPGFDSAIVNAMKGETAAGLLIYDYGLQRGTEDLLNLTGGQGPTGLEAWFSSRTGLLWRPVLYADGVVFLKHMAKETNTATMPYRLYHKQGLDEEELRLPGYAVLARSIMPMYERFCASMDDARAEAALAQVLIAALQYKKRVGAYPSSLEQLAVKVPSDPYSGTELIYKRSSRGFEVYSIGQDLRDNHGTIETGNPDDRRGDLVLNWPGYDLARSTSRPQDRHYSVTP